MLINTIIDYLNIVHGNSTTCEAVIVQKFDILRWRSNQLVYSNNRGATFK